MSCPAIDMAPLHYGEHGDMEVEHRSPIREVFDPHSGRRVLPLSKTHKLLIVLVNAKEAVPPSLHD